MGGSGRTIRALVAGLLAIWAAPSVGEPAALKSGPQVGERPLPFTSNMVTGPKRGTQHCYI